MKRLVFIVEGNSEVSFINNKVIPYLYSKGCTTSMHAQTILTNRKLNSKGGVISYDYLKNDIKNVLAQKDVIVTTFIDFYKLPTNFPNYSKDSNLISAIEKGIKKDIGNENLFPYIQLHELEALLFSSIEGFEFVVDDIKVLGKINEVILKFSNPEDINHGQETAPSKRLNNLFPYNKVIDSEMMFDELDINTIMEKCPRFKNWIMVLQNSLKESLK